MDEKKKAYQREYYQKNREVLLEKQRARSKANYAAKPEVYRERAKRWKAENPERMKALQTAYQEANRDKVNARSRAWYAENKAQAARQTRRRKLEKYGLTFEAFEAMLAAQRGLCLICRTLMNPPVVDHCHRSGKVRGLLCRNCNSALGLFREKAASLIRAARYLIRSSSGATSTTSSKRSKGPCKAPD